MGVDDNMAKKQQPIMSYYDERYMAHSGLIQWSEAVIRQAERIDEVFAIIRQMIFDHKKRSENLRSLHTECHYFSIAAYKVTEHLKWLKKFENDDDYDLFENVDFSGINKFTKGDLYRNLKDLRDMREHVVEYFRGGGYFLDRWRAEGPGGVADASSMIGNMIGGRLDYVEFSNIVKGYLPALIEEPLPYLPDPFNE